ncbi:MAG: HEPN domain-containing protein [Planctomycetota bacterium]|nr:HEPN domain-containing protein [Planctomycetota bacterium]
MPRDAEIRQWLAKAREDRAAAVSLQADRQGPAVIGFHCQQAAEKVLKALLIACGEPFAKVHDLDYLLTLCERHEPTISTLRPDLASLEPFAVTFRYPTVREPDRSAADAAVVVASQVIKEVEAMILARMTSP